MAQHNIVGKTAEDLAANHMLRKGYTILARNWRHKRLEVDIIARKADQLAVVEVKARSGTYFELPQAAVGRQKQKFLAEAADAFINKNNIDLECRFDVIAIVFDGKQHELEHIENAFYPFV